MGKEGIPYTPPIIEEQVDIMEETPLTVREERALFNEEWNADKQIRRMKNMQIAHGLVGQQFFNHGVSGTIYKRRNS